MVLRSDWEINKLTREIYHNLFQGNESAYGQLVNGKHITVKSRLTPEVMDKHLRGEISVGRIPIREDGTCNFGAMDLDDHHNKPEGYKFDYNKLKEKIEILKLPLTVFKSKSGGAHCYLFLDKFYPARDVIHILKKFRYALGYTDSVELFPKQSKIDPGKYGNFINLSYHGGNSRVAINPEGKDLNLDEGMSYAAKRVFKLDDLAPYKMLATKEYTESYNVRLLRTRLFFEKFYPEDYENKILKLNQLYDKSLSLQELYSTVLRENFPTEQYTDILEPEELPKELVDYDVKDFLQLPIDIPLWIIKNLIRQETINFIVAPKGVGKSEFVLGLLWAITTGNPFLEWEVPEAHPGNYIDFEMGRYDTTERLQKYQKRWGYGNDNYLKINHFSLQENENIPDIKNEGGQKLILDRLKLQEQQTGKKPVVVIDNLRSASNYKENNSDDFRPIGIFFRDLRSFGYTVIVVDHAGKEPKTGARGSSSKTDWANVVLLGERAGPKGQKVMKILWKFDKARGLRPEQTDDFVCEYDLAGNWRLAATDKQIKDEVLANKIEEIQEKHPKMTQEQIGKIIGKSAGTVNTLIKGINTKKEMDEYWVRLKESIEN